MARDKKTKMTKEESLELTKTLVLNFNELETVATYEKKTSNKPAVVLAIIGFFAIFSGLLYPSVYSLVNKDSNLKTTKLRKDSPVSKLSNKMICTKNSTNDTDKISTNSTISLNFKNSKLINYNNESNYKSIDSNIAETPKYFVDLDNLVKELMITNIDGYKLSSVKKKSSSKDVINNYILKVNVDLEKLDITKLTDKHKSNEALNVVYTYNENYDEVKQKLIASGYTCN